MRVIEDACARPRPRVLDFGPGDAAYKQQFSNESHEERNLVAVRPDLPRPADQRRAHGDPRPGPARKEALDAAQLTDRVRSGWRGRASVKVSTAIRRGPR